MRKIIYSRVSDRHNLERRNVQRIGRRGKGELESRSWRNSLFSIFVTNFDWQVTATDIRRVFTAFGVVVDVFLPNATSFWHNRYAFVRFRFVEEYQRVVQEGNDLIVAGRKLVVRQAAERQIDRRRQGSSNEGKGQYRPARGLGEVPIREAGYGAMVYKGVGRRMGEHYSELQDNNKREIPRAQRPNYMEEETQLRGKGKQRKWSEGARQVKEKSERSPISNRNLGKTVVDMSQGREDLAGQSPVDDVNLDIHMVEEDLEWLFRSAIGYIQRAKDIKKIQQELQEGGLPVLVR